MSQTAISEKIQEGLAKIGNGLKTFREQVYQEDEEKFAYRLSIYSSIKYTKEDIKNMESGNASSIQLWIGAWLLLQTWDVISEASLAKPLLFLASQKELEKMDKFKDKDKKVNNERQ